MSVTYRKINPSRDEDIKIYFSMQQELDDMLSTNCDLPNAEKIKWQRIRMGATELRDDWNEDNFWYKEKLEQVADEYAFICEDKDTVVGYISVCTYHIVNGDRPNDDIGIIDAIYVKDNYRGTDVAYNLLQLGLNALINAGKNKSIVTVQQDNPNRFLHFALADKLIRTEEVTRADGRKTNSYDLLISDLQKLKNMSFLEIGRKAVKIRRNLVKNNLSQLDFIND